MSENSTITETRTVRELAREYLLASSTYSAAYKANSAGSDDIEVRIDLQLACDAALKAVTTARIALDAAQKVTA